MTVSVAVDNGGEQIDRSATIAVTGAEQRRLGRCASPSKNEKPEDNQFFARDDKNEGTLYYNGTLADAADSVFREGLCRRQTVQDRERQARGRQVLCAGGEAQAGADQVPRRVRHEDRRQRDGAAHGGEPRLRRRLPDRRPVERRGDRLRQGRPDVHERVDSQLRQHGGRSRQARG